MFIVEQLSKHGSTTTMQQNLKILYVSMFVVSSHGTATTREKVHAFTDYVPRGPCKKLGLNGKLSMVRCKIFIDVEKREKLFVPKFNSLQKHIGHQKVLAKLSQR